MTNFLSKLNTLTTVLFSYGTTLKHTSNSNYQKIAGNPSRQHQNNATMSTCRIYGMASHWRVAPGGQKNLGKSLF
jgi:hypothetical protein